MTSSTIRSVDSLWAMMNVVRPAMQLGDGRLQALLGDRVDARRRLVEHDEVGLAQPHPGQGQQLRLARRQAGAAGAERAVDAAGGERAETGARAAPRSTASSVGAGSNSVTLSRIVPSNSSTSWGTRATRRRSSAIGMSAIGTPPSDTVPVGRLDEAQQQPGERRLAAAGAADDADRAAGGDVEVDVVEDRLLVVVAVGERHAAARDAERARRRATSCRASTIVGCDLEQVDDAHHRPVGLLHRLQLVDQVLQRAGDQQHVLEQQERRAERDRPVGDERGADDEGEHRAGRDRALHAPTTCG